MLNSMALDRAGELWVQLLVKGFIHAQSWTRRAARARTNNSLEALYPVAKSD
jgi:hypothetical protein